MSTDITSVCSMYWCVRSRPLNGMISTMDNLLLRVRFKDAVYMSIKFGIENVVSTLVCINVRDRIQRQLRAV